MRYERQVWAFALVAVIALWVGDHLRMADMIAGHERAIKGLAGEVVAWKTKDKQNYPLAIQWKTYSDACMKELEKARKK